MSLLAEFKTTTVVLSEDLTGVGCWNFTGQGSRFTLPAGLRLQLDSSHDLGRSTWLNIDEHGQAKALPLIKANGSEQDGYRFIISNDTMTKEYGVEFPPYDDFLDLIIAYEEGNLDEDDTRRMFADPRCRHLQGHYSSRCTAP